jgi:MoxR-like ATPase
MNAGRKAIITELQKQIVGQADVIELVLLTLFVGGNSLIVGVPGLAKTLLISTLAKVLDLKFNRIQFTPDLMPSDITGTDIIQEEPGSGRRRWCSRRGRSSQTSSSPTKSTARRPRRRRRSSKRCRSTASRSRAHLHARRAVLRLATQNPIELEGTYPLPEAQLDRFMFHIVIEHPPKKKSSTS